MSKSITHKITEQVLPDWPLMASFYFLKLSDIIIGLAQHNMRLGVLIMMASMTLHIPILELVLEIALDATEFLF